jgi:hypothetical protein
LITKIDERGWAVSASTDCGRVIILVGPRTSASFVAALASAVNG